MAQEIVPFRAIAAEPLQSIPVLDRHFLAECLVTLVLSRSTPSVDVATSYKCDTCGNTFSCNRGLARHKSIHNNKKRTRDEPLKKSRKRPRCVQLFRVPTTSSQTGSASSSLDEEQVASSAKGPYKCNICGKTFSSFQALGGHKSSKRPTSSNIVNCPTDRQLFPDSPGQTTSTSYKTESASSCPEEPGEIDLELRLFPGSTAQTVSILYKTHSASSCAKGTGEIDLELRLGTMIR